MHSCPLKSTQTVLLTPLACTEIHSEKRAGWSRGDSYVSKLHYLRCPPNSCLYSLTVSTREWPTPPANVQAGHGAMFWVDIPYVPENEDEAPKDSTATPTRALEQWPQSRPSPQPGVAGIHLRVLLVEDSLMIQVRPYTYPGQSTSR